LIVFNNLNIAEPYIKFKHLYDKAFEKKQNIIQAICISSFSNKANEVDSRFVNLKSIDNTDFIFFSNYDSPKSYQFESHNQISAVIFWSSINIQIRVKAQIKKVSREYSDEYFKVRSREKNALAISSKQSQCIDSYDSIVDNYNKALENSNTSIRPEYWGGYMFTPYEFEFWEGHDSRLNKRDIYRLKNDDWKHLILQP
tara:strand:- start:302 stop:898 length:597 start_codon:yes stop_codon:yes gene_type:complete